MCHDPGMRRMSGPAWGGDRERLEAIVADRNSAQSLFGGRRWSWPRPQAAHGPKIVRAPARIQALPVGWQRRFMRLGSTGCYSTDAQAGQSAGRRADCRPIDRAHSRGTTRRDHPLHRPSDGGRHGAGGQHGAKDLDLNVFERGSTVTTKSSDGGKLV